MSFMKVAEQCVNVNNLVCCSCKECQNAFFKSLHTVKAQLKRYGTVDDDEMYNLIHDMCEPMSIDAFTSETNIEENVDMTHDDNREFTMCAGLLEKAGKSLFPSSKLSALSFIVKLMHIKVLNKLSNKAIDMILQLFKEAFPKGTILPSTTYDAKKLLKDLGLGYEVIHACKYDCALF
ncbi:hypothetical protein CISIN_1g047218mg [Citrus sinensis]|uniref:Uncharacterized protein n=1 Tax=Citrus sinensis TaxID=2711 RepID=A0A067DA45_CITSI|nr:hypothetical protein CISIN_1g047218mg [Citrus sinensis]